MNFWALKYFKHRFKEQGMRLQNTSKKARSWSDVKFINEKGEEENVVMVQSNKFLWVQWKAFFLGF